MNGDNLTELIAFEALYLVDWLFSGFQRLYGFVSYVLLSGSVSDLNRSCSYYTMLRKEKCNG